jgi:hypothetical protein
MRFLRSNSCVILNETTRPRTGWSAQEQSETSQNRYLRVDGQGVGRSRANSDLGPPHRIRALLTRAQLPDWSRNSRFIRVTGQGWAWGAPRYSSAL